MNLHTLLRLTAWAWFCLAVLSLAGMASLLVGAARSAAVGEPTIGYFFFAVQAFVAALAFWTAGLFTLARARRVSD
jgi:hypothetical protein